MLIRQKQLPEHLKKQLDPLYFITGSELLLEDESVAQIVEQAKTQGFTEVERKVVSRVEEWFEFLADAPASSLFAEKRVLVVQLSRNIFSSPKALAGLEEWVRSKTEATIIVLRGWAWDYRFKKTTWFKKISSIATTLTIETLPTKEVPGWIESRAKEQFDLDLSTDAVGRLAELTDGNLSAAHKELEKLQLIFLNENRQIEEEDLSQLNWSLRGVFDLLREAGNGNAKRVPTMLAALHREAVDPLALIGAITSQLRKYHDHACNRSTYLTHTQKQSANTIKRRFGHQTREKLEDLMVDCAHIDCQRKGIMHGDSWLALESLLLNLAGYSNRSLDTDAQKLRKDYDAERLVL